MRRVAGVKPETRCAPSATSDQCCVAKAAGWRPSVSRPPKQASCRWDACGGGWIGPPPASPCLFCRSRGTPESSQGARRGQSGMMAAGGGPGRLHAHAGGPASGREWSGTPGSGAGALGSTPATGWPAGSAPQAPAGRQTIGQQLDRVSNWHAAAAGAASPAQPPPPGRRLPHAAGLIAGLHPCRCPCR